MLRINLSWQKRIHSLIKIILLSFLLSISYCKNSNDKNKHLSHYLTIGDHVNSLDLKELENSESVFQAELPKILYWKLVTNNLPDGAPVLIKIVKKKHDSFQQYDSTTYSYFKSEKEAMISSFLIKEKGFFKVFAIQENEEKIIASADFSIE